MAFKTTLSTLTGPEEAGETHTLTHVGQVKFLTKQMREASGKASQVSNKTPQRSGKTKNEFIKTTKKVLNTQEHYQVLRCEAVVIFLLHR